MSHHIFVVDNDAERAQQLHDQLAAHTQREVFLFDRFREAREHLAEVPTLVILSAEATAAPLSQTTALLHEHATPSQVLLIDAPNDVRRAVEMVRDGVADYLPASESTAQAVTDSAADLLHDALPARDRASVSVVRSTGTVDLVGDSPAMQHLRDQIATLSGTHQNVLIQGETGVGKEGVARAIHDPTGSEASLLSVDGAIVSPLQIKALFLPDAGDNAAATAASAPPADRSAPLLLDHVEELGLDAQAVLDRLLHLGHLQRIGETDVPTATPRVLSLATRELSTLLYRGGFREDLYHRLAQSTLYVPPLRERPDDIPLLADHFLQQYIDAHPQVAARTLTAAAKDRLREHTWPGNARQLRNLVVRTAHASTSSAIEAHDLVLPPEPVPGPSSAPQTAADSPRGDGASPQPARSSADMKVEMGTDTRPILPMEDIKRQAVQRAYELCDGDVDRAAVELGIGRSTVYRMLDRYDIRD